MEKKLEFSSREDQEKIETIKEERGIVFFKRVDPETNEEKSFLNILGVEVETYATEEDIKELKERWILSEFDQEILRNIAECYKLRQPLMLEGGPGTGKTFLLENFIKMIHGKDAPILSLTGTSKTTDLEILGHWIPKGSDEENNADYEKELRDLLNKGEGKEIADDFNQKLTELNRRVSSGVISEDDFQNEYDRLFVEYRDKSYIVISQMAEEKGFTKSGTNWQFKEGPLLQAYSGRGGRGNILFVDEFNLIPSNHQQIFLRIGGKEGAIADSFDFHGNSGGIRYLRGKDTWICFASNYPERTGGRGVVVDAMADRLVWTAIPLEASSQKKSDIIRTGGGRLKSITRNLGIDVMAKSEISIPAGEQLAWSDILDEQIGEQIVDLVDILDKSFVNQYRKKGDKIIDENGEIDRIQQFDFSSRAPLRLFAYLDQFQVKDPATGRIDFAKTIYNGFKRYYLACLASPIFREEIDNIFKELIYGDIGKIDFEGKVRTRKEVFDILVERVSGDQTENGKKVAIRDKLMDLRSFGDSLSKKSEEFDDEIKKI